MKCSQTNRSNSLMILFSFGLILFSAVNCAHAEEPDSFSIPSEDSASPTENKEAGSAEEANPAEAPGANPAEAPGANPAEAPGAEPAEEPSAQINPSMTETEQVDSLAQTCVFKPVNEKKDPFKPLVQKTVNLPPPMPGPVKPSGPTMPPPQPPVKPIQIAVNGICGNDNDRLAMVVFENKFLVLQKDQNVDGKFKVVDILPDKLVVYSNKEQMRRSFSIGGGKE